MKGEERRFESLFEEAPDAIFVVDLESGKVLDANRCSLDMCGFTKSECQNLKIQEILPDPAEYEGSFNKLRAGDARSVFVATHRSQNGSTRRVSVSSSMINHQGRIAALCIMRPTDGAVHSGDAKAGALTKRGGAKVAAQVRKVAEDKIDPKLVKRLIVVHSGFFSYAAMEKLLANQAVNIKYILYPDRYDEQEIEAKERTFLIFASADLSDFEVEDLEELCKSYPKLPILTVCVTSDVNKVIGLIKAGVRGVISKEREISLLPSAINAIAKGELWYPRSILQQLFENYHLSVAANGGDSAKPLLSEREIEILTHIVKGLKNKEIADKLGISYSTVLTHTYNIYRKLEVKNRAQAIMFAINSSLVKIV